MSVLVFFYFLLPLVFALGVLPRNEATVESVFKLQAPPDFDYGKMYKSLWAKIIEEKYNLESVPIYKEKKRIYDKMITVDTPVLFKKGVRYTDAQAREILMHYPSIIDQAQKEGEERHTSASGYSLNRVVNYLYALNDDGSLTPEFDFYFNDSTEPVKLYSERNPEGRSFDIIYQKEEEEKTTSTAYPFRVELDNFVKFTKPKKGPDGNPKKEDITEYVEFKRDVILDPYLLLFADNQDLFERYQQVKTAFEEQKKIVRKAEKTYDAARDSSYSTYDGCTELLNELNQAKEVLKQAKDKIDKFIYDEFGKYYDTKLFLYNNADPSKRKYQIYKTSTPTTDTLRTNALSALKTKHDKEKTAETNQIKANQTTITNKTQEKASKLEELEYEWVKDKVVIKKGGLFSSSKTTTTKCKKTLLQEELDKGDTLKAALKTITDQYEQKKQALEMEKKRLDQQLKNDMLTAQSEFNRTTYQSMQNQYKDKLEALEKEYKEMEKAALSATLTRADLNRQLTNNIISQRTYKQRMQYLENLPNRMASYPQDKKNLIGQYIPKLVKLQENLDQNEKTYQEVLKRYENEEESKKNQTRTEFQNKVQELVNEYNSLREKLEEKYDQEIKDLQDFNANAATRRETRQAQEKQAIEDKYKKEETFDLPILFKAEFPYHVDRVINTLGHYTLPGKLNDFNIDNYILLNSKIPYYLKPTIKERDTIMPVRNPQTGNMEYRVIQQGEITQHGFPTEPKLDYQLSDLTSEKGKGLQNQIYYKEIKREGFFALEVVGRFNPFSPRDPHLSQEYIDNITFTKDIVYDAIVNKADGGEVIEQTIDRYETRKRDGTIVDLSQYPQLEYIEAKEDTKEPNQEKTTKIIGAKGLLEVIPYGSPKENYVFDKYKVTQKIGNQEKTFYYQDKIDQVIKDITGQDNQTFQNLNQEQQTEAFNKFDQLFIEFIKNPAAQQPTN
ncbi:hypothetical protein [Candidatus Phytoplasma pruni]|uniref:hypothetical protein n=1 Tax=Candidatus Phytoplasma pruni TaxID=479893 RepID=UPI001C4B1367|nr:hypothetical protein [Candidatus Phytoplasma pruni]